MEIRLLQASDVDAALRLSQAAGWNQTKADWEHLLDLAPSSCFGIEMDGTLASTTTAVLYGRRLAWIGMVLTLPEFRGQGLANRLLTHTLAFLEKNGVDWAKLDATDMGRPIYSKLGFAEQLSVQRWHRPASPVEEYPGDLPEASDFSLDIEAFGTDRSGLLEALAPMGSVALADGGFAMARRGRVAAFFGPAEARNSDAMMPAIDWFLGRHGKSGAYWDLFPDQVAAAEMARHSGFSPQRTLTRMQKRLRSDAEPLAENTKLIYAGAGFEFG